MSGIIDVEKRHVFPVWRTFEDALKNGELDPLGIKAESKLISSVIREFDFYTINNWKKKNTLSLAADILNFASMHHKKGSSLAIEAANFINNNSSNSGISLLNLSNSILDINQEKSNDEIIFDKNNYHINSSIFSEIRRFKEMVKREPKFAVGWIELARRYSVLSQKKKAETCVKTALFIDKNNRFVIRGAARFYIHMEEYEKALYTLVKSSIASTDPWVLASILGLTRKIGKQTNHLVKGQKIIKSHTFNNLEVSELASALGTLELFNGKMNKAKKLFESALLRPSDNAYAQVCWHSTTEIIEKSQYTSNAYEASTINKYRAKDFVNSFKDNLKWIQEEPFSTRPILTASYHASIFLDKHKESIELTKLGLKINPSNEALKNNLAYDLLLDNKLNEAKLILDNIDHNKINKLSAKISLIATRGLFHFRNNEVEMGREMYLEAMNEFKKTKNNYMEALAFVNYAREEILANTDLSSSVFQKMKEKYSEMKQLDIQALSKKVEKLYTSSRTINR